VKLVSFDGPLVGRKVDLLILVSAGGTAGLGVDKSPL
jgi:hypothetical protein